MPARTCGGARTWGIAIGAEAMWSEPHRSIGLYQLVINSQTSGRP
ncbi:hypothetical protein ATKI12_2759 [Kitasatospora sp. Ki12]